MGSPLTRNVAPFRWRRARCTAIRSKLLSVTNEKPPEISAQNLVDHPLVREVFDDPRYKHLRVFADYTDPEAEEVGYDRVMTLQALAAIYTLRSTEKQGEVMARATWALVLATVGLVAVTLVLVIVTMQM